MIVNVVVPTEVEKVKTRSEIKLDSELYYEMHVVEEGPEGQFLRKLGVFLPFEINEKVLEDEVWNDPEWYKHHNFVIVK